MITPATYIAVDPGHAILDFALAVALIAIAMRANRYWPLLACSFVLAPIYFHAWQAWVAPMPPLAYGVLEIAWAYPPLVVLITGTLRHVRRIDKYGVDICWVPGPGGADERRANRARPAG